MVCDTAKDDWSPQGLLLRRSQEDPCHGSSLCEDCADLPDPMKPSFTHETGMALTSVCLMELNEG